MSKFEKFEQVHQSAMREIQGYRDIDKDSYNYGMVCLVEWMLKTDINPYQYVDGRYAGLTDTSTGFLSLLNIIHHALYDDGEIEFVSIDGQPKMVFANRYDNDFYSVILSNTDKEIIEKTGRPITDFINVLDVEPKEFITLCEQYHKNHIQRCYVVDAARHGISFADSHYSSYDCWEEGWRCEFDDEIKREKEAYEKLVSFKMPVEIRLNSSEIEEARRAINTHYHV